MSQPLKGKSHVKTSEVVNNGRSRSKFRVHIVGSFLIAWAQVLEDCGTSIKWVVQDILDPIKDIRHLVSKLPTITLQEALLLEPLGLWDGCLFANILNPQDSKLFATVFARWCPAIAVISMGYLLSKADIISLLPINVPLNYKKRMITVANTAVGGVSTASHRFVHYMRWPDTISYPLLMTSNVLSRTLKTALSDTFGASPGTDFEPRGSMTPPEVVGVLSSSSGNHPFPVYSGDRLAPDLASIPFKEVQIWVQAHSIYSKDIVLRQVRLAKLFAIWDYEGKLESVGWSPAQSLSVLKTRLLAPPAKMLRCFAQSVFDAVLLRLGSRHAGDVNKLASDSLLGLTRDVLFSPLKEKVLTQVAATQADDAKVDLTAWSSPQETEEEAKARVILRWFAVRWWAYNLGQEAMSWWNRNGWDPKDLAAIQDCIFQARASSYWYWH